MSSYYYQFGDDELKGPYPTIAAIRAEVLENAHTIFNDSEIERTPDRWYFRATARERAEAFLRALGKWATTEDSSAVGEGSRSC